MVAFVLFFLGLLFGMKFIINVFSDQTFEELRDDAVSIAEDLMTGGYPANWTEADVVMPGLLTSGLLDPQKVQRFARLNYSAVRLLLNTRYDYYVSFEDLSGGALAVRGVCGAGHPLVQQNATNRTAVFFQETLGEGTDYALAEPALRAFEADLYFRQASPADATLNYTLAGGLSLLLNDVDRYSMLVLEDPNLNTWSGSHNITNVTQTLERWASGGRSLVLTGHVDANTSFFASWPASPAAAPTPAAFTGNASLFAFPVGENFTPEQPQPLALNFNLSSTEILAGFPDGRPAIAAWNVGLGTVLYVSDVRHQNGSNMSDQLLPGLARLAANCSAPDFSALNTSDLARFERVVAYHSGLIKLKVAVWEDAS